MSIYSKNKAETLLEDVTYKLIENKLEAYYMKADELVIEFICKYPIDLRIDKFLSDKLGLSRSAIKNLHKKGSIIVDDKSSLNSKIRNGVEIHFFNSVENIKVLSSIV